MRKFNKVEKTVVIFVLEVILFWIMWFVYGFAYLNFYENITDFLRIVTFIWMIAIILSAVITFVFIILESNKSIKILPVIVFVVFVVIHLGMYFNFSHMGYTTGGDFSIVDKKSKDNAYYFYIDNSNDSGLVKIKCEKEVYDRLIIDKDISYAFTYRWLTYNDDVGVLEGVID